MTSLHSYTSLRASCIKESNVRKVLNGRGQTVQETHYYPYGMPFGESNAEVLATTNGAALQPYKYGGKEAISMCDLNFYDFAARPYDPATALFFTPDPHRESYQGFDSYLYCIGDPINIIDPTGCDTININFVNDKWTISDPIIAEGNDVFIVNDGNNTQTFTFSDGEYGNRVVSLNLENHGEGSYALGVYHVSGEEKNATGFYVTPGGESSIEVGSGKRIPEGSYPFEAPTDRVKWRTPGLGGSVSGRGIRFHYGSENPLAWTEGCFVVATDYTLVNGKIKFDSEDSKNSSINFNKALGASEIIQYKYGFIRTGAKFPNSIKHTLHLQSR